jgi:hypothetical protein
MILTSSNWLYMFTDPLGYQETTNLVCNESCLCVPSVGRPCLFHAVFIILYNLMFVTVTLKLRKFFLLERNGR